MYILVIKLCCVFGIEVDSSIDTDEKRVIRPTGFAYRQFSNHQPEIVYFNGATTYRVDTSNDWKVTTQPTILLNKSIKVSESSESNDSSDSSDSKESEDSDTSDESNDSDETSESNESKKSTDSRKRAGSKAPKTDFRNFQKSAREYYEQKQKSNAKPPETVKPTTPPKKHVLSAKKPIPKKASKGKGYETYEPQSEEDLQQQPNYQHARPYGFVYQTPPTKGMASNYYRSRPNAPFIFGNPFNFRWPIYRRVHVVPVPRKPPPPVHKPPAKTPKMKHVPPKMPDSGKKDDTPKKPEPPKKDHKKSEEEEEEEEHKKKVHESKEEEDEESNHSEHGSKESDGKKDSKGSEESSSYSEHKSVEKKKRKKFEDKDETEEEGRRRGHKTNKKDDKGGHNSNESGFQKESGVKYNNENRKRKGFKTDNGYKNTNTFGKGKKKDYDEEHLSDFHDKNHDKKATEHDASQKYGNQHDGYHGDKGGKFNEHKLHKKGSKTTGYHNTFHKDEYKKVHTFYDDADHQGKFKKFGSAFQKHDAKKGGKEDHEHEDSGYESEEQAKKAKLKKGHNSDEDENWSDKHSHKKGYSENEEYSNENGHKTKNHKGFSWK